jgi:hypothetical protein
VNIGQHWREFHESALMRQLRQLYGDAPAETPSEYAAAEAAEGGQFDDESTEDAG